MVSCISVYDGPMGYRKCITSWMENKQLLTIDKLFGLRWTESENYSFMNINSHLAKRSGNKRLKGRSSERVGDILVLSF